MSLYGSELGKKAGNRTYFQVKLPSFILTHYLDYMKVVDTKYTCIHGILLSHTVIFAMIFDSRGLQNAVFRIL